MQHVSQSPTDPGFVQDPYRFYDRIRPLGPLVWWNDYAMPFAAGHAEVSQLLRDKRFGRENLRPRDVPSHLTHFYAVEAHSMLELEPPRHTRLRGLVLRAFTSRRLAGLQPEIDALCHTLIDGFPDGPFDVITHYAQKLPVIIIARLLGVPEEMAPQLLAWSNAMVGMYQAGRGPEQEHAADRAAAEFSTFLTGYIDKRRSAPRDDLITSLIAAEEDGQKLCTEELITTCILLLNAGHEATVHTLGNAARTCLQHDIRPTTESAFVEEALRHDPPLHIFTRYAMEDVTLFGHDFAKGDQVGLLLGAANRDPAVYPSPAQFIPDRTGKPHTSFGAGIHFCVGAPLARMEIASGLSILFQRCPDLKLAAPARFGDVYHFHGLAQLIVTR